MQDQTRSCSSQEAPSSHSHRTSPPPHTRKMFTHPQRGEAALNLPQHLKQEGLQAFPSEISLLHKRHPRTNILLSQRGGRQPDHKQAQVHKNLSPRLGCFTRDTAYSGVSPSPTLLIPHVRQGMSTGLSHPCGQGRKTFKQGGSRERHPGEPISPSTTGQHPRIVCGLGRGSTTAAALQWRLPPAPRYQVLSPLSLQDLMERMAPRGAWATAGVQSC